MNKNDNGGNAKNRKTDDLAKPGPDIPGLDLDTIEDCRLFVRGTIRYIAKAAYKDAAGRNKGEDGETIDKSRELLRTSGTLEKAMSAVSQHYVPLLRDKSLQDMDALVCEVDGIRREMQAMEHQAEKDRREIEDLMTEKAFTPPVPAGTREA